jgi:hypothetical protein
MADGIYQVRVRLSIYAPNTYFRSGGDLDKGSVS